MCPGHSENYLQWSLWQGLHSFLRYVKVSKVLVIFHSFLALFGSEGCWKRHRIVLASEGEECSGHTPEGGLYEQKVRILRGTSACFSPVELLENQGIHRHTPDMSVQVSVYRPLCMALACCVQSVGPVHLTQEQRHQCGGQQCVVEAPTIFSRRSEIRRAVAGDACFFSYASWSTEVNVWLSIYVSDQMILNYSDRFESHIESSVPIGYPL